MSTGYEIEISVNEEKSAPPNSPAMIGKIAEALHNTLASFNVDAFVEVSYIHNDYAYAGADIDDDDDDDEEEEN